MYIRKNGFYYLNKIDQKRNHGSKISITGELIENIFLLALDDISDLAVLDKTSPEWDNQYATGRLLIWEKIKV